MSTTARSLRLLTAALMLLLVASEARGWERLGNAARKNAKGKGLFRSGLKLEAARVWEEAFLDSCGGEELGLANNLGVVHYQLAQPQAAFYFFQYALTLDSLGTFHLKNRPKVEAAVAELEKTLSRTSTRLEIRTLPVPNAQVCFASEDLGGCYKTPFTWCMVDGLHLLKLSREGGKEVTVEVTIVRGNAQVLTLVLPGPAGKSAPAGGTPAGESASGPAAEEAGGNGAGGFARTVAGSGHSCGLDRDGRLSCWVDNRFAQLGGGTCEWVRNEPAPVLILPAGVKDVAVEGLAAAAARICAGSAHTCALLQTGIVVCWGANAAGQLGDGTAIPSLVPVPAAQLGSDVKDLTCTAELTCITAADGSRRCVGTDAR